MSKAEWPYRNAACDQDDFKNMIKQGLAQLNLDEYGEDPTTDIAQDLDRMTIQIEVV